MHQIKPIQTQIAALLALALAAPAALAYGNKDAIRDCESHIRSEYKISDLRDAQAEQIMDSEHHYKVHGLAKVDGDKHPWSCEIKNRHVTMAEYSGPKPKGMSTAEKLAIGAAAAVATGVAVSEASKHGGASHSSAAGAAGLQDLVGARASGGESELESRGYNYVAGSKWSNGWHCVTVHTADGHYKSIVDTPMANCH